MSNEDVEGLEAAGLKPIIIDENTDFSFLDAGIRLEENTRPKTNGKRNKAAGHSWERELVIRLKPIFPNVGTTRNNSRARDAQKVDIMNIDEKKHGFLPFNIQAKNEARVTKFQKHLAEMPQEPGTVNVVAFKQTEKQGSKFMKQGEYAIMYLNDWFHYIEVEQKYSELVDKYHALSMEFNCFKNKLSGETC